MFFPVSKHFPKNSSVLSLDHASPPLTKLSLERSRFHARSEELLSQTRYLAIPLRSGFSKFYRRIEQHSTRRGYRRSRAKHRRNDSHSLRARNPPLLPRNRFISRHSKSAAGSLSARQKKGVCKQLQLMRSLHTPLKPYRPIRAG